MQIVAIFFPDRLSMPPLSEARHYAAHGSLYACHWSHLVIIVLPGESPIPALWKQEPAVGC